MIIGNDNKWRVSVEGQLDLPFDTQEQAQKCAAEFEERGFDCSVYFSPTKER